MIGDRVRLTPKAVLGLTKRKKNKIDWANRRGTIKGSRGGNVNIKWDDRRTVDEGIPFQALEVIQ